MLRKLSLSTQATYIGFLIVSRRVMTYLSLDIPTYYKQPYFRVELTPVLRSCDTTAFYPGEGFSSRRDSKY